MIFFCALLFKFFTLVVVKGLTNSSYKSLVMKGYLLLLISCLVVLVTSDPVPEACTDACANLETSFTSCEKKIHLPVMEILGTGFSSLDNHYTKLMKCTCPSMVEMSACSQCILQELDKEEKDEIQKESVLKWKDTMQSCKTGQYQDAGYSFSMYAMNRKAREPVPEYVLAIRNARSVGSTADDKSSKTNDASRLSMLYVIPAFIVVAVHTMFV